MDSLWWNWNWNCRERSWNCRDKIEIVVVKLKLPWQSWNCRERSWNCRGEIETAVTKLKLPWTKLKLPWWNWNCRDEIEIAVTLLGHRNFLSPCRDATKTDNISHFHNGLTPARAEPKLFLAEKLNKCDRGITGNFKKNIAIEGRAFNHLNQRILPRRTGDILSFFVFSVLAVTLQIQ